MNTARPRRTLVSMVAGVAAVSFGVSACEVPGSGADGGGGGIGGNIKSGSVPAQFVPWIVKAAGLCPQMSAPLLAAQLFQESAFNPNATSPVGAQGIAQFMPSTWPGYGVDADGNGKNSPWDAPDAIMAQGKYMCELAGQASAALAAHKVSGDVTTLALAGYNAGWGAVVQYHGVPPFTQTQQYVQLIPKMATTKFGGVASGPGGGAIDGSVSGKAKTILEVANRAVGLPYVWGGGSLTGPTGRDRIDGRGPGYDCSGMTRMATYVGTGGKVTLPRTAAAQQAYTARWAVQGGMSAWKPGDLLFWHYPATHVAMYWGGGKIIEAPTDTQDVHITQLWGNPTAARPPWVQ